MSRLVEVEPMDLNEMAPLSVDPAWYDAPETWHSFVGPIDLSTARAEEVELWGELSATIGPAESAIAPPEVDVPYAGI